MDGSAKKLGLQLLLLFVAALSLPTHAATTKLTSQEAEFLNTVRTAAIARAQDEKIWTQKIIQCLKNVKDCRDLHAFQSFMIETPQILATYRSILILGNYDKVLELAGKIPTYPGYPTLDVEVNPKKNFSELAAAVTTRKEDREAIEREWANALRTMRHTSITDAQIEAKIAKVFARNSSIEAQKYYRELSKQIAVEFPYIPFISKANPKEKDYIKAMKLYLGTTEDVLKILQDPATMPLESFLSFANLIENEILLERRDWNSTYLSLLQNTRGPEWTYKNWIEAFTSVIGIATNVCFVFAAIAEAWPIAVACGTLGTAVSTYFLSKMILDYMKESKLARLGFTSDERMEILSGRLVAQGLLFAIGIRAFSTTIAAAEGTLTSALQFARSNLATRFTNKVAFLGAMKEWFKGYAKDNAVGASIRGSIGGKHRLYKKMTQTKQIQFPTYSEVIDAKNNFVNTLLRAG